RMVFVAAAPRVGIKLRLDEFAHRADAVAGNHCRVATRGGNHSAAYDQDTVFVSANEPLHDHSASLIDGHRISGGDFLLRHQVGEHTAPMIAIARLDHHRKSYL